VWRGDDLPVTVGPVLVEEPAGLSRLSFWPPEWTHESACLSPDVNPRWWHSNVTEDRSRARVVCAGCPVRLRCAIDALERAEVYGIWGGLDLEDRRKVARRFGYDPPGAARCGTRSRYVAGCRCPDCRRAHAVYEHARRLKVDGRRAAEQAERDRHANARRRARAAAGETLPQAATAAEAPKETVGAAMAPPVPAAVEALQPAPVIEAPQAAAVAAAATAARCPRAGLPWRPTRRRSIRYHPLQLLADL